MASPFFWGIMFFSTPYSPSCLDTWKFFREKNFFSQNLLPLCHQPPETTVFQTHAGGGSKVAGGSKAPPPTPSRKGGERLRAGGDSRVVTSNDSPNLFTTVKAAFSCVENIVFQRRKRHFSAWQHTHYAQQLPSPRGGVGGGAGWSGPCCHSPTICHHRCFPFVQRASAVLVAEWQQKQKKIKSYRSKTQGAELRDVILLCFLTEVIKL